jgi:Hedgehog amino-terminal signalling domain
LILKDGARIRGLKPEILVAILVADSVHRDMFSTPLVVTEATGGTHHPGSLHYNGLAIDVRTNDMDPARVADFVARVKEGLGADYDVVVEADHVHIEHQPKVP